MRLAVLALGLTVASSLAPNKTSLKDGLDAERDKFGSVGRPRPLLAPENDVRAPRPGHLRDAFNGDDGPGDDHDWRGGDVLDHGVERDVPPADALPSLDIIEVREVMYDNHFMFATADAHGTVKAGVYPVDLPESPKTWSSIQTYQVYGPVVVSDPSQDDDADMVRSSAKTSSSSSTRAAASFSATAASSSSSCPTRTGRPDGAWGRRTLAR
ncbi:unnamed protein product [Pelagomonas calceolata]|uniref:Phospholipase B-like n=1 Tax=Pelagomonas calceolata TaxID=35677 RepID=A0A8J2SQB5_9STRA|nr:unnamed protein product [Pelagomonas calceolata]